MVTRKDIEDLGFYYWGESFGHGRGAKSWRNWEIQNIKAYSIKLKDDSYCHIHFFDNDDGSVSIDMVETTDMYGGADEPFTGWREGGNGPYACGGLRIINKDYLLTLLDILGVVGENYDNRYLTND